MTTLSEVIFIHDILISRFGGSKGIRDKGLLESAMLRPYHTFDGTELYSNNFQKAAALIESIVTNHPFVDGNKRTGYVLMRLYLMENGIELIANQEEKYDFVIQIASGLLKLDAISFWIENHSKTKE